MNFVVEITRLTRERGTGKMHAETAMTSDPLLGTDLTLTELATIVDVTPRTIHNWIRRGLPAIQHPMSKRWGFVRESVVDWLEHQGMLVPEALRGDHQHRRVCHVSRCKAVLILHSSGPFPRHRLTSAGWWAPKNNDEACFCRKHVEHGKKRYV